uniref:Secreted protein n=1 Tax=Arundo donax TaxID=35708 RepID=A0A0A9AZY1_ARUDO
MLFKLLMILYVASLPFLVKTVERISHGTGSSVYISYLPLEILPIPHLPSKFCTSLICHQIKICFPYLSFQSFSG